jgi:hypothetical protein
MPDSTPWLAGFDSRALHHPHYISRSKGPAMNKLKLDKQEAVIRALVEGSSIRSVERMTGVHRDTIMRLIVSMGTTCNLVLDDLMRGLNCRRIEVDEVWCYVGKKQRHVRETEDPMAVGDFWTWVALDSDTKLIPRVESQVVV